MTHLSETAVNPTAAPRVVASAPATTDLALLLLRLVVGGTFLAHAYQKWVMFGIQGVTGSFEKMGVPMAGVMAPLTASVELLGGLLLVLGLFTRYAGAALAVILLGAIATVHLKNGFFSPNGIEFPLVLMAAALALALLGPGRYALGRKA